MSNIFVTAIGSFSADTVIKNLHNSGHRVVGIDIYPGEWVANSLQVDVFYQSPYAFEKEKYISWIDRICEQEEIDYIIPLTDVEVDILTNHTPKRGTLCISSTETIKICRDKYELYQFLKQRGINCLIETEAFSLNNVKNYTYPLVLKPRNGRSSQGLHFVKTEQQLLYLAENENLDDYIVQPQKEGCVVTVDVLRNENFFMATPRVELLRTLNGAGTSVKVFSDNRIELMAKEIADCLAIKGCVNLEFICKEDSIFFMECNPRFSGGVAFSCMAGYDYINNHLKCFGQLPLDQKAEIQEKYIARKYTEFVTG